MNLAIIIAGITWNTRRKGRSMAPTDRPYGGRGVEGGEPLPNLMTFTCGAGAHYNILYGLSRPRSWSTPPPVDRQGLTWRLSEWDARPNRAPGAVTLPPVDLRTGLERQRGCHILSEFELDIQTGKIQYYVIFNILTGKSRPTPPAAAALLFKIALQPTRERR